MKKINPNFNYNLSNEGRIVDTASMFCHFFDFVTCDVKAREIRRVLQSHICNKFQLISLLINFLIDLSRKIVEDFIKIEADKLSSII